MVATTSPLPAQTNTFCVKVGGPLEDGGYSIVQTTDGGYAIAGYTYSFGAGSADVYVVKLDSAGNLQWSRTIGGPGWDEGRSIIQTIDGGYAIAGTTRSFGQDLYVVKLDSSGNLQWAKTIGGPDWDNGFSIIQTADGGYAIAGNTYSFGAGDFDVYIVKLDANGNLQWGRTIGGSWGETGFSIIQTTDGGYAIAGYTRAIDHYPDIYVVKLDGAGNLQWDKVIRGTNSLEYGYSIIQTLDGGYAITGQIYPSTGGAGNSELVVVKLDGAGNLQWTTFIGGANDDIGYSIIQTADSSYIIAGLTVSYPFNMNYGSHVYIVKLDKTGTVQWTKAIGHRPPGNRPSSWNDGYSIIRTTDNGYAIVGRSAIVSGEYDVYVVKLDSSLNLNCGQCEIYDTLGVIGTEGAIYDTSLTIAYAGGLINMAGTLDTPVSTHQNLNRDLLVTTDSVEDVSCTGWTNGAIYLTVTGGRPPYQHRWSNGDTTEDLIGIPAGTYTDTITDACGSILIAGPYTVNEPPQLTAIADSIITVSCAGGSDGAIYITVSGGTPPYQHRWNTGDTTEDLTGIPAGTYANTITDANGCTMVAGPFTVGQPPQLAVTLDSIDLVNCAGRSDGAIYITVRGGTPPYQHRWSNGDTTEDLIGIPAGTYTDTITDACGSILIAGPYTVNEPTQLTAIADTIITVSCAGSSDGAIYITVRGGTPPYQHRWNTGDTTEDLTGIRAGTYTDTITDANGCTTVAGPFTVGEQSVPCGPTAVEQVGGTAMRCVLRVDDDVVRVLCRGGHLLEAHLLGVDGREVAGCGSADGVSCELGLSAGLASEVYILRVVGREGVANWRVVLGGH